MIALIVNPAKNKAKLNQAKSLLSTYGMEFRDYVTQSQPDIEIQTKKAISDGVSVVVCCGGDGTLLGVINGCVGTDIPIAILPLGCSNDYATELGMTSIENVVNAIRHPEFLDVPLCEASYRKFDDTPVHQYFCSTAGVGFMGSVFQIENKPVFRRLKAILKDGIWPILCIIALAKSKPTQCTLTINQQTLILPLLLLEISKTKKNGGVQFVPHATVNSNILEAWMIISMSKWVIASSLIKALLNLPFTNSRTVQYLDRSTTKISVNSEVEQLVHLNGDLVGKTPVTFQRSDRTVRFIVPAQ